MKQKKFTAVLPILSLLLLTQCKPVNKEYTHLEGNVFGTYYHITYLHPKGKNLAKEVEDKFLTSHSLGLQAGKCEHTKKIN